jgi:hypothetical protein
MAGLRFRLSLRRLAAAVVVAALLLLVIRPYWPGWVRRYHAWQASRQVHAQLERRVSLRYPAGIALDGLLLAVQQSTRGVAFPRGVRVLVDAEGLTEVQATMATPVIVDRPNDRLGTSLRSALHSIGLDYIVRDGNLTVVSREAAR